MLLVPYRSINYTLKMKVYYLYRNTFKSQVVIIYGKTVVYNDESIQIKLIQKTKPEKKERDRNQEMKVDKERTKTVK